MALLAIMSSGDIVMPSGGQKGVYEGHSGLKLTDDMSENWGGQTFW